MAADDVAGDGHTQPHPLLVGISARLQPAKGREGLFIPLFWNSRSVVVHQYLDETAVLRQRHIHMLAVFQRVVDEIGRATLERIALYGKPDAGRRLDMDAVCTGRALLCVVAAAKIPARSGNG